jgi:uncharacterized protein YqjF (DUF2071 family)
MINKTAFLTADWRYLTMLNYEIDPALLAPYVPAGTELDFWQGRCYISVVGFLFLNTRLRGLPIPGHINFEEVNLRFYVGREAADGWRRGVVFIKELVPRRAIAAVARWVYNENYQALPMRHRLAINEGVDLAYEWRFNGRWQGLQARAHGAAQPLDPESEATFITEHYWGYARQRDGGAVEYQVEHPPWRVWTVNDYQLDCDVAELYGTEFVAPLQNAPTSIFIAEGSAVSVHAGRRL